MNTVAYGFVRQVRRLALIKVKLKIPYSLGEEDADVQVDCTVTSNNPNPTLSTQLQIEYADNADTPRPCPSTALFHLRHGTPGLQLFAPLALVFLVLDFSSS